MIRRGSLLVLAGLMATAACSSYRDIEQLRQLPGFETVLPRGRIPAINAPVFVPAVSAKIDERSWVIGVSDGVTSKAYSINLLNSHEVVNDTIGGRPIATTW